MREGRRGLRLRVCPHRARALDLAEEPAKLAVADHREGMCHRAGACREQVQLEQSGSRSKADAPGVVEVAQIVA